MTDRNAKSAMLTAELDRLYSYWQHIDDRLHSTLQLLAGVASLLTAATGVKLFADSDTGRWLALGSLLIVLGLIAAAAAVLQAGNQAGKLVTIVAMERLRRELIGDDSNGLALPTFGRLHVRVENEAEVATILAGRRHDYRPITIAVAAGAAVVVAAGVAIVLNVNDQNTPLTVLLSAVAGALVVAGTLFVSTRAARLLAVRMARGFDC